MAKKKKPKEASQLFENIMKASVKGNPKPKLKKKKEEKGMSEVRKWKREQGLSS